MCGFLGGGDALTLRQDLLQEIRQAVPFDAYAWVLTDPETSVGSTPLAEVAPALLPQLPRLIRLKYLTEVNRWTALDPPVALLHETTGGDVSRSLLWRELLSHYDIVDMASAVFRDRFGCWAFLELWRARPARPFTAAEAAFLASIDVPVTTALRRCQAGTFITRPTQRRRRVGPVVLLLSPDLNVVAQTPATMEYLRVLVPPSEGAAPIPASAYHVAAQLLAVEAGVDENLAWARAHLSDGLWLTMRAARIGGRNSHGERNIAITIEEASSTERMSVFARAYGLSAREAELLGNLMAGDDTSQIARRMFLSQHTVQDHLKSIFAKTSVRTRRALLSLVLGT